MQPVLSARPASVSSRATMRLREALALESLTNTAVVAGHAGLDRELQWVHCVDLPDPRPWVSSGQMLLTTGAAWPSTARAERQLIADLHARGLVAVGIPLGEYLRGFSDDARAEADVLGFPLLEIPHDVAWADVTREVHQALLEQDNDIGEAVQLFARLTHAASESADLQYLAEVLSSILARGVVVTSVHGHVLATSDSDPKPSMLQGLGESGVLPPHLMAALRTTEEFARLQKGEGPIRIPGIPEAGLEPLLALPLSLRERPVAVLWISEGRKRVTGLQLMLAEHAASVAAIQLAHQSRVAAVATRLGGDLMETLLRTGTLDAPEDLGRVRMLGLSPNETYRVVIVNLHEADNEDVLKRTRQRVASRLNQVGAPKVIAVKDDRLTFVLPAGVDPESALAPLMNESVSAVVSRPHDGLEGLPDGLREATLLLQHVAKGKIERYENLLISRILVGDADAREPFLEELLGDLRRVRGGEQLVETVLVLAMCGFGRNRAAEALHVHANTLRYRLSRVEQVGRVDLGDPETQFRLQLAARLVNLPESKG